MTHILLENFDCVTEALNYDTDNGPEGQIEIGATDQTWRGYYCVSSDGKIYGVFATRTGPVAFREAQQWPLQQKKATTALIKLDDNHNRVTLHIGNNVACEVTYTSDNTIVDNWSDDDRIRDFFSWLHNSITDKSDRFFKYYTLN